MTSVLQCRLCGDAQGHTCREDRGDGPCVLPADWIGLCGDAISNCTQCDHPAVAGCGVRGKYCRRHLPLAVIDPSATRILLWLAAARADDE